jgi:Flp pilus assembly protein TadD
MARNKRFVTVLGLAAGTCSAAMVIVAVAGPVLRRREVEALVREADATLSPPLAGRSDVDEVDCDRADALLREALDLDPHHGPAQRLEPLASGCSALRRGDLILAEGALRTASTQLENDPRPQCWLGSLALVLGRPDAARTHFERSLEIDPGHAPSRLGLSDALAESGMADDALRVLDDLAGAPNGLVEVRRGMILEDLGRTEDAERAYRLAAELSPGQAAPWNNLAALAREQGDLDAAWELQQRAVELAPDDPVMVLNAGLLAIAMGLDDRAEELLGRAAELDHDTADPARALADHLLVRGVVERALEVLGPAIEQFPRDAALRNSLGNALAAAGRPGEARRAYQTALDTDEGLAEAHNGLAALSMAEGDLAGALVELERALELSPDNEQARQNLSVVRDRLAERDLASGGDRLAQANP